MKETNSEIQHLISVLDSRFFKSLSEPTRIEILKQLLLQGELDINALAEKMPQDRSVISRHLSNMKDSGLLLSRKEGRHMFYSIDQQGILRRFESILESMRRCIEKECC